MESHWESRVGWFLSSSSLKAVALSFCTYLQAARVFSASAIECEVATLVHVEQQIICREPFMVKSGFSIPCG